MEKYKIPEKQFDPNAALRARITHANMLRLLMLDQWKKAYESFWQTPRTHGERAVSKEDMQAIIDLSPATVIDMLQDSGAFIQFMSQAHPDVLQPTEDEEGNEVEALLPERYLASPYEYQVDQQTGKLTLQSLKDDWDVSDPE